MNKIIDLNKAAITKYLDYEIDEDILIYEGRFTLENGDVKLKCRGNIIFKVLNPSKIIIEARVLNALEYSRFDFNTLNNLEIDLHGYQKAKVVLTSIKGFDVEGYIDGALLKSKNANADYVEFDIMNLDLMIGRVVNYNDNIFSGRIQIEYENYIINIDKRPDFRKEMYEELIYKSGNIITHTGRIFKKDGSSVKTSNIAGILEKLSLSLSLVNSRRIHCINAFGYCVESGCGDELRDDKEVFRLWRNVSVSSFMSVPNWTSTISNIVNIEKFIALNMSLCKKNYYLTAIDNICMWYIESIDGYSLANNVVSVQTALEMISYVILVEMNKSLSEEEFDSSSASKNIKRMLEHCKIDFDLNKEFFSSSLREKSASNVDLLVYLRNRIIHPSQKTGDYVFEIDDVWNLILLGITYIELGFLYIIGYKGEYTNRFLNDSFGEVENTTW